MRLSELQSKKIVDVNTGTNLGHIVDISISNDGTVDCFYIEEGKGFFSLTRESDLRILWSDIEKIGEDVILIKRSI